MKAGDKKAFLFLIFFLWTTCRPRRISAVRRTILSKGYRSVYFGVRRRLWCGHYGRSWGWCSAYTGQPPSLWHEVRSGHVAAGWSGHGSKANLCPALGTPGTLWPPGRVWRVGACTVASSAFFYMANCITFKCLSKYLKIQCIWMCMYNTVIFKVNQRIQIIIMNIHTVWIIGLENQN